MFLCREFMTGFCGEGAFEHVCMRCPPVSMWLGVARQWLAKQWQADAFLPGPACEAV